MGREVCMAVVCLHGCVLRSSAAVLSTQGGGSARHWATPKLMARKSNRGKLLERGYLEGNAWKRVRKTGQRNACEYKGRVGVTKYMERGASASSAAESGRREPPRAGWEEKTGWKIPAAARHTVGGPKLKSSPSDE